MKANFLKLRDIYRLHIEPMRPGSSRVRKKGEILVRRGFIQGFGIFHYGYQRKMDGEVVRLE